MDMALSKIKNSEEAYHFIETQAEKNAVPEIRYIELRDGKLFEPKKKKAGFGVRQGDIYIHLVDEKHRHGDQQASRQLALGESRGSRHVAEIPAKVFTGTARPDCCQGATFLGPCIVSEERFVITHPEHAHIDMPAGTYQITHQMDARSAERVRD